MNRLSIKCFINKRNGQVNISLPKKKIPIDVFNNIKKGKKISFKFDSLIGDD